MPPDRSRRIRRRHAQGWSGYTAVLGIAPATVAGQPLRPFAGWAEVALGLAVLAWPVPPVLVVAFVWKVGTEVLRPLAGEPIWEFIERGGSYAAPLGLLTLRLSRAQSRFAVGRPSIVSFVVSVITACRSVRSR